MKSIKLRWAFDPYIENKLLWERTLEFLNLISEKKAASITPTYIVGSDLVNWVSNMTPTQIYELQPIVEKAMTSRLKSLGCDESWTPDILFSGIHNRKAEAKKLAERALESEDDLLVLNTFARTGMKRFFQGSFAENTLLVCKTPMLFISPNTRKIESLKRVFVPTNFCTDDERSLTEFLEQYGEFCEEIILYSKMIYGDDVYVSARTQLATGWLPDHFQYTDVKKKKEERSKDWVKKIEGRGLKVKFVNDTSTGRLADGIEEFVAKEDPDMVFMTSYSGQLDTILSGSTAREVVRRMECPVMVKHVFNQG